MEKCNYCGNKFKKQTGNLLWDNELYCETCVNSISPDFSQYVSSHESFIEKGPNPLGNLLLKTLWIEILVFIIFYIPFTLSFGFLGGLEVTGTVMAIQMLIMIPAQVGRALRSIPIIEVKGGWITFYRRNMKRKPTHHIPLHKIKWRVGNAKDDSLSYYYGMEQENVIVLEVPYKSGNDARWFCYTCGWTTKSKKIWLSFFELAGVECKKENDMVKQ